MKKQPTVPGRQMDIWTNIRIHTHALVNVPGDGLGVLRRHQVVAHTGGAVHVLGERLLGQGGLQLDEAPVRGQGRPALEQLAVAAAVRAHLDEGRVEGEGAELLVLAEEPEEEARAPVLVRKQREHLAVELLTPAVEGRRARAVVEGGGEDAGQLV